MPEYTPKHSIAYPLPNDRVKDTSVAAKLANDIRATAVTADAAITNEGTRAESAAKEDAASALTSTTTRLESEISDAKPYKGEIPNNANINDYVTSGWRRRVLGSNVGTIANIPADMPYVPFRLESFEVSSSITHQVITAALGGQIYSWVRYQLGSTWQPWHLSLDTERDIAQDFPFRRTDRSHVTIFGDSQVEGATLTTDMQASLDSAVSFANRGRSGDTADQVAIRAGAKELWFNIIGGQIPTSGAVSLTTMQPFDTGRDRSFGGTLAGIPGTLRFTASNRSWEFTRSTTGSAVTVEDPQAFISAHAGAEDHTLIVWMGGNNSWETGDYLAPDISTHVISVYQEFMNWAAPQKRVLFPGMTYGKSTAQGADERKDLADTVNDWLAETYPAHFGNINTWLIEHGMTVAGLTDTQEDLDARDAGLMPPSLLVDSVHFKHEVRTVIGRYLVHQLSLRGWTDGTVSAPLPVASISVRRPTVRVIALEQGIYEIGV